MTSFLRFFLFKLQHHSLMMWGVLLFFAAWGGVVRYLTDNSIEKWSWAGLLSQMTISCFTGMLGGIYGYERDFSNAMTLICVCVCSTFGCSLFKAR